MQPSCRTIWLFLKFLKNRIIKQASNSTSGCKELKAGSQETPAHHVHSSITHNGQKVEAAKVFITNKTGKMWHTQKKLLKCGIYMQWNI